MRGDKLLICIAFHYVEDRLKYVMKLLDRFSTYDMAVSVIIDSNKSFNLNDFEIYSHDDLALDYNLSWIYKKEFYNNISISTYDKLDHPWHLTWMHRKHFADNIDNYNWFMYLEDDIDIPYENFNEYVDNFGMLWEQNSVPSFVRLEKYNNKYFVTDVTSVQDRPKLLIKEKEFVNLTQPYHAFWIMPQKELKSSLSNNFIRTELSRENAASYPMWELKKTPLVRVENNKISKLSYSYHLTNNYATYPNTPFGKIEINNLLR